MNLRYLVTGTGRCGTVFMARFLTSLGINCGHESIFDWRGHEMAAARLAGREPLELSYCSKSRFVEGKWQPIDKWLDLEQMQAESSYMAAPYLRTEPFQDAKVIHVVRNPFQVIQSFVNYINYFKSTAGTNCYENFIYTHVPELTMPMSKYERATLYYLRWNQMIERSVPDVFHKIEDDKKPILDYLGMPDGLGYFEDNTVNTFKKPCKERFSIDKIQSKELVDALKYTCEKYGYRIVSECLLI